jgi:S-DNA-T family DNA segregation ATPase FtsK/SpoIIIE
VGYLATNYGDQAADELALNTAEAGPFTSVDLEDDGGDEGDDDELYEEAREIVIKAGKASASYLQRKLKVGYARAARLLDMLEERGVIGPGEGAKQREVYEKDAAPTDF